MANRRFTIWDVVPQTVHLARVRWAYFLVLLSTFITGLLLIQGSKRYVIYTEQQRRFSALPVDRAAADSCLNNILRPWLMAAINKTLTASQQEDFYKLSLLNCTMFKTPVEALGSYVFINGTARVQIQSAFALPSLPGTTQSFAASAALDALDMGAFGLVTMMWGFWVQVAVAWGLHAARSTTTPSYTTRPLQHRNAMFTGPEKLIHLIREQFSGMVFRGVMRVLLTTTMVHFFFLIATNYITAMISTLVAGKGLKNELSWTTGESWEFANPLRLLFVLHSSVAALEPEMWGFKALFRAIQLTKGNRWNSLLIHVPLSIWEWLWTYIPNGLLWRVANYWPTESIEELWLPLIGRWILPGVKFLPRYFLVPAFYFLCKSCREKVATMA